MADQVLSTGVLGRLPPWPRKPLNSSVIAAEQAYRKRSGLPELTDADIEALKAGEQMPWEKGEAPAAAPAAPAAAAAAPPAPAAPAAASGSISAEVAEWVKQGKKWSRSAIAAEQARRKRTNLAPLNDAEITALTGEAPEAPAAAPAATPAPAAAAVPAAPPSGTISPEVAGWVKQGKKWSRSSIAAEQARRKRNNLQPLNDAEIYALTGEAAEAGAPAAPAAAPAAPAAAARAAAPAPAKAATVPPITRSGTATTYVGSPAVGTSKAAAAGGVASGGPADTSVNRARRRFIWTAVVAFLTTWLLAFFRFFLPRTLFEPSTVFKIGYPSDFGMGVDTKFQQMYRIWVDRIPGRIFVIYAKCTHLGCTPDWKPAENKFKCPCHGSGYDSEGVNFEGPAPRPMDRCHVELAPDGQIIVDASQLYQWPKGQPSHFDDPGAFLSV